MIRRTTILIFIGLTFAASGCDDFLQEKPTSFSSAEEVFSTETGITEALNGVYQAGFALYRRVEYVLPYGITTDELFLRKDAITLQELENFVFTPTNPETARIWTAHTRGISRANQLIEAIADFPDKEFSNRITAEAKLLRAWYYFGQVRTFGAVPLLTSFSDAQLFPANSTIPDIYAQIVRDLREAEVLLPGWRSIPEENGRATRSAARSLLGKVYLTMATLPEINNGEYFTLAAEKLKEVIEQEGHALIDEYREVFWSENEGGPEDIFAYQFKAKTAYNGHIQSQFSPNPDTYNQRGLNVLAIAPRLYDMLEPSDERRKAMIRGTYTVNIFDTQGVLIDSIKAETPMGFPYTQKYRDPYWGRFSYNNHDTNLPFIRYADVLLMYAEAVNESGGPTDEIYEAINAVRERSSASMLPGGMSREEIRQAIRDERYFEFHGEGHRWFDLVRWGVLKENVEAVKPWVHVDWPNHRFFPIPQTEIDVNSNLLQNIGYRGKS